VNYVE